MNDLKIGSLFTGYGGLDMAVTGATTTWVSDIDKGACKILAHRYPTIPNLGDITAIDWATVEPVDIITGGFPCQDLSHAGKRAGLKEGTRSGLWSHMAKAINELRPRLVVAENVRGLLSADAPGDVEPCPWCVGETPTVNLRALGVVLADLADLGYDAQWCGLRAADVGACHGRFRVFLIAYPSDTHGVRHRGCRSSRRWGPGFADDDREPVSLLPTPRSTDGSKGGPNQRGSSGDLMLPSAVVSLLPTPAVNDMGAGKTVQDWDAWTDRMKAAHRNGNGHGKSLSIETQRLAPVLLPTPDASAHKYRLGGDSQQSKSLEAMSRRGELDSTFKQYAPAVARQEQTFGRPAPALTEPTGRDGAHRLSPLFVEWMMGLPEGWVTDVPGLSRNQQLKALGNGVVPRQAETALRHMMLGES